MSHEIMERLDALLTHLDASGLDEQVFFLTRLDDVRLWLAMTCSSLEAPADERCAGTYIWPFDGDGWEAIDAPTDEAWQRWRAERAERLAGEKERREELQRRLETLEPEHEVLQQKLSATERDLSERRAELEQARAEAETQAAELTRVNGELEESRTRYERLHTSGQETHAAMRHIGGDLTAATQTLADLTERFETALGDEAEETVGTPSESGDASEHASQWDVDTTPVTTSEDMASGEGTESSAEGVEATAADTDEETAPAEELEAFSDAIELPESPVAERSEEPLAETAEGHADQPETAEHTGPEAENKATSSSNPEGEEEQPQ